MRDDDEQGPQVLNERFRLVALTVAGDLAVIAVSLAVAFQLHGLWRDAAWTLRPIVLLTSLLALAVTLLTFTAFGLYKYEVYVSRPLHLATLFKAVMVALVVGATVTFFLREPVVTASRFVVVTLFALVFLVGAFVRIGLLDRLYRCLAASPRRTVVVGRSLESGVLVGRLRDLRGYARVHVVEPPDRRVNGHALDPIVVRHALDGVEPQPAHLFIDVQSVGHRATLELVEAALDRGVVVYIVGRLLGPLDTTRLLLRLFELPVSRVRHRPAAGQPTVVKRAYDIVGSAVALVLLSPVLAVIAVAVKRDSAGPALFHQRRVGLQGRPFDLLKFRTMEHENDEALHRDLAVRFVKGDGLEHRCDDGTETFKCVDDPRITRLGRFLRKYSLDELPQFWNVLRGDMSLVGPRPAVQYEVDEFADWHRRRQQLLPGMTGVWQVAGRNRTGIDEMVFQDIMYGYSESLWTDLSLCARTIPAMLIGRGAG